MPEELYIYKIFRGYRWNKCQGTRIMSYIHEVQYNEWSLFNGFTGGIGLWGGKCILQDPAMQRSERECGLFMEGGASKCRFKGVVGGFSWLADSEFGPGSQIFEPGSKVNIKSGWTEKMEKLWKLWKNSDLSLTRLFYGKVLLNHFTVSCIKPM